MTLDFTECDRARLTRDPSYDGRFFTGDRTTGVYCRPVCPVRKPLSRNVCFFPSAAAAELAGFRSLRRFNAVFVETYRKSPTEVRQFARANGRGPGVGKLAAGHSDDGVDGSICTF